MSFVSGLVVYILLWWWVFLMTLPFGVKAPDAIATGHATSAPAKPMLWRKAGVTTVIAGGFICAGLLGDRVRVHPP
jgi:predicted secreted protein